MLAKKVIATVLFVGILLVAAPTTLAGHGRGRAVGRNYYRHYEDRNDYWRAARFRGDRHDYWRAARFRSDRNDYWRAARFRDSRNDYWRGGRFRDGRRDYRGGLGSTGRALLTVGAPAAVGAGIGALLDGKKGAAIGALLGGGGGAAYYLIRNRRRR